jgi:hypothetical protein
LRALAIGKLRGVCEADGARDNGKWGVLLNSEATGVYVPNARTGKEEYRARGVATVNKERDCDKASVVFFLATEKKISIGRTVAGRLPRRDVAGREWGVLVFFLVVFWERLIGRYRDFFVGFQFFLGQVFFVRDQKRIRREQNQ